MTPSSSFWKTLNNSILVRYLLLFGCGWSLIVLINFFYGTIAIFTGSAILAALLNYPVVWLSRYLPRGLAIAITTIVAFILLFRLVTGIGLEAVSQGKGLIFNLTDALGQQDFLPFKDFLERLDLNKMVGTLQTGLATGLSVVQGVFSSVFTGVFGAVISVYMLIDGDKLWRGFLQLLPPAYRERFAQSFRQSFLGFIRGQLLLMLFLSLTSFFSFSLLGIQYGLVLAGVLGVIDAIPGIGATLGILLVTILTFTSQGPAIAVKAFIVCVVLVQIQDNIIRPKVMGNALELNPVILFLSLFIGERIAGLLGIFLSIPIAGMIAIWIGSSEEKPITDLEENQLEESQEN
ncbi:conserved membrane hypothetical protein [Microcystis aeruginosa PCC 9807]|uniref:Permease n=1 Tax=Microcystis aeruginosa PCC 9807 TaxID=1160283 RepID=I4H9F4_MICAE|nr:AI-2E family transporter [Microcystis aeruginosa]CCI18678.1 conserved membrane hypothetical protein [Microcystis aeruginosa PCC 9807]